MENSHSTLGELERAGHLSLGPLPRGMQTLAQEAFVNLVRSDCNPSMEYLGSTTMGAGLQMVVIPWSRH
jgi:hypothetical protein